MKRWNNLRNDAKICDYWDENACRPSVTAQMSWDGPFAGQEPGFAQGHIDEEIILIHEIDDGPLSDDGLFREDA